MNLKLTTEPLTLRTDAAGVVRVGDTRVSLDTVIRGYLEGSIPEEIVEQFPSLQVADVYAAIGYYLKHKDQVDEYLVWRRQQREKVKQENETRANPFGLRERLSARMKSSTTK